MNPLTEAELDALAALCRAHLPPGRLEALAADHALVADIEALRKAATAGAADEGLAMTRALLAAMNARGAADWAVEQVMLHDMAWSVAFCTAVLPYTRSARQGVDAREAMLAARDNFMALDSTEALMDLARRCVCALVADPALPGDAFAVGTGALVGPDLVLTAGHVVAPLIAANRIATLRAVFDFDFGEALATPGALAGRNALRTFPLAAAGWQLALSPPLPGEGLRDRMDAAPVADRRANLDLALVRLAEPAGRLSRRAGGGPARGWIELAPVDGARYGLDTRLILPQHPAGMPIQVDFGRISHAYACGSRIRSTVSSARGSSGAPCFDRHNTLIALHNAAAPAVAGAAAEENQAIRLDAAWGLIAPHLAGAGGNAQPAPLWNAAPPGAPPRPILGRARLTGWIASALAADGGPPSQPAYVALAEGTGTGRGFTLDILAAALRDRAQTRIVVFGNTTQMLPDRAEDMAAHLARQLGVPEAAIADLPRRPQPGAADDQDRVNRWMSTDLPAALATALGAAQVQLIDRAAAARARIDSDLALGLPTPDDIRALALSGAPPERRVLWREAWVALDDLPTHPMSAEVKSLVAALMGMDRDGTTLHPALAALRWLFLGHLPDFVRPSRAVIEDLAAFAVTRPDIEAVLQAAVAAQGRAADAAAVSGAAIGIVASQEAIPDALFPALGTTRLRFVQDALARAVAGLTA